MVELIFSELKERLSWCPPATQNEIEQAEHALGFPLPLILKKIYAEIGNGSPDVHSGFIGVPNQSTIEKHERLISIVADTWNITHWQAASRVAHYAFDIVAHYKRTREESYWEFGKIPIEGDGNSYDYVDCLTPNGQVYMFDHTWGESFADASAKIADSLEEYFYDCLFDNHKKRQAAVTLKFDTLYGTNEPLLSNPNLEL